MKTTVDLPDALLRRAKRLASEQGITLKMLIIEGLEHATAQADDSGDENSRNSRSDFLTEDRFGVPVLKSKTRTGKKVTNAMIDNLRDTLEI